MPSSQSSTAVLGGQCGVVMSICQGNGKVEWVWTITETACLLPIVQLWNQHSGHSHVYTELLTQSEMDGRRQWKYFFWVYTLARSERKTKTQWEYLTQSRWVTNLVVLRWYLWTPTKRAVTALPASTHIHLRGELYHSPKGKGEVAIKNEKGELRRPSISKVHKCLWKRQFSPNPVTV